MIIINDRQLKRLNIEDYEYDYVNSDTNSQTIKRDKIVTRSQEQKLTPSSNLINLNKGELGEINIINKLFSLMKKNKIDDLVHCFGPDAEHNIIVCDIETQKPIIDATDIKKSKSTSKADTLIMLKKTNKFLYISIKCTHGANPAILNHTPRSAKVFQKDGALSTQLDVLDTIIKKLNMARTSGEVNEDIKINSMEFGQNEKECIYNVGKYFMFEGTGSGNSKYPSNAILTVGDYNNIKQWKYLLCDTNEQKINYIKQVYDLMVFSLRNKGMPKVINNICIPWIYKDKSKQKGSLHIRLMKLKI